MLALLIVIVLIYVVISLPLPQEEGMKGTSDEQGVIDRGKLAAGTPQEGSVDPQNPFMTGEAHAAAS